jgi:hypothetical protein
MIWSKEIRVIRQIDNGIDNRIWSIVEVVVLAFILNILGPRRLAHSVASNVRVRKRERERERERANVSNMSTITAKVIFV